MIVGSWTTAGVTWQYRRQTINVVPMVACWSFPDPDVAHGSYRIAAGEVQSQHVSPEIRARTSEIVY
jgi:hypothetical protein